MLVFLVVRRCLPDDLRDGRFQGVRTSKSVLNRLEPHKLGQVKKNEMLLVRTFFKKEAGGSYYLLFLLFLIYWNIMSPKPQLLL